MKKYINIKKRLICQHFKCSRAGSVGGGNVIYLPGFAYSAIFRFVLCMCVCVFESVL